MDLFSFPPLAAALDIASSALLALTTALTPMAGTAAAAVAVLVITLMVRAALIPVGISQARAEQTRFRLAPKLLALQRRFRKDPERLQRELQKLYRDEQASPFAGLLPVLLQAPVIGILYAVFMHPTIAGHANTLLQEELFGVPLGASLAGSLGAGVTDPGTLLVFGAVVLSIAVVGELTRRFLRMPEQPRDPDDAPAVAVPPALLGALQFVVAVVAVFVPLAAGLYLAVTVAWTFVQRLILRRRYPLVA